MILEFLYLLFQLLVEIFHRQKSKPESKNNGDTNIDITIDIDINH